MSNSGMAIINGDGAMVDVRHQRFIRAPAERVWETLTSPEWQSQWLFDGAFGRADAWDPPRSAEWRWNEHAGRSSVRFELTAEPGGTNVLLVHHPIRLAETAEYLAGWHAHLDRLTAYSEDAKVTPESPGRYENLRPLCAATGPGA